MTLWRKKWLLLPVLLSFEFSCAQAFDQLSVIIYGESFYDSTELQDLVDKSGWTPTVRADSVHAILSMDPCVSATIAQSHPEIVILEAPSRSLIDCSPVSLANMTMVESLNVSTFQKAMDIKQLEMRMLALRRPQNVLSLLELSDSYRLFLKTFCKYIFKLLFSKRSLCISCPLLHSLFGTYKICVLQGF